VIDDAEMRRVLDHIDGVIDRAGQAARASQPLTQERLEDIARAAVLELLSGRPAEEQMKLLLVTTNKLLTDVIRLRERMATPRRLN
jgi:hypothetical protein